MVWLRDLAREGKSATLNVLMDWMSVEMKSRMRATAPVRSIILKMKAKSRGGKTIANAGYARTPPIGQTSALNLLLSALMND